MSKIIKEEPNTSKPEAVKEEIYIKHEPIFVYEDDDDIFKRMTKKAFGEEKSLKFQEFVDANQRIESKIMLKAEEIETLRTKIHTFNQSVDSPSTWNWKIRLGRMCLQKINLEFEQEKIRDKIYEMLYQIGTEPEPEVKKSKQQKTLKPKKPALKRKALEMVPDESHEKVCLMPKRRRKAVIVKSET